MGSLPAAARLLKRITLAFAGLYVAGGIALYAFQHRLTYDPHPLASEPDAQAIAIPARETTLHGWVVNPGKPDALVYFGGKGESVEKDIDFFRSTLPRRSIYLVPYRGYGPNAGTPTEADLFADALVVHDWVRARHARVAAMGRSLGTGVATWLASRRPLDRLVLATPYDSFVSIGADRYPVYPMSWMVKDRFESDRYAPSVHAPVLVLLAEHDRVIPRAHSDALIRRFPAPPRVVVVPRSGHNDLNRGPAYARALRDFMDPAQAPPPMPPSPVR